jgi:hypothetical protein
LSVKAFCIMLSGVLHLALLYLIWIFCHSFWSHYWYGLVGEI